ncbi:DUF7848 domain-containing protein [Streptomyces sp. NPDC004830]
MTLRNAKFLLKPAGKPVRQRIECETCGEDSRDESDVRTWAASHMSQRSGHETFIVANETFWRLEHAPQPTPFPAIP